MKVEKAKSIDQLYKEVKDYDLVLTAEASLADALNNRMEEPRLGHFATTPLHYVLDEHTVSEPAMEQQLFIKTVQQTDLDWKTASHYLSNLIESWQETGDKEYIKNQPEFKTKVTDKILEIINEEPNVYTGFEELKLDDSKDVAVVNFYQFTEMDKKILPDNYDVIEPFTEHKWEMPEFKVYSSVKQIVEAVRRNTEKGNPGDIAVVSTPESSYTELLQSQFSAHNIPYISDRGLADSDDLRTFIRLLRASISLGDIRVKELQPVLKNIDISVSVENDNKYISSLESENSIKVNGLLDSVGDSSFTEALERYEEEREKDFKEIRELLEDLDIEEEEINSKNLDELEYFLDSFETELSSDAGGVLFASPKSVSKVDRPVVFFLGMGSEWDRSYSGGKDWIDSQEKQENAYKDFQSLIQSGQKQYYLVKDIEEGDKKAPSLYIQRLTEVEDFTELPHERYSENTDPKNGGFGKADIDSKIEEPPTFSNSSLKKFFENPKNYFFYRLTDSAGETNFEKGTIFHDFAEFYIENKDYVESRGIDEFVDISVEMLSEYLDQYHQEEWRKKFEIGLRNLSEYIDSLDIQELPENEGGRIGSNNFVEKTGEDLDPENTELYFSDKELGINGSIDLVVSEEKVVDFKSGGEKEAEDRLKQSLIPEEAEYPDFQHLMYLSLMRKHFTDKRRTFTYVHFLSEPEKEAEGEKCETIEVDIGYIPQSLANYIASKEFLEDAIVKEVGPEDLDGLFDSIELRLSVLEGETSELKDKLDELPASEEEKELLKDEIVSLRKSAVFSDDLDWFEDFLQEKISEKEEYCENGFPSKQEDLEDNDYRELILNG